MSRRPGSFDRNLVVIGAGSAGLVAAYVAAAARAKVTLVEAGAMGGDCLNRGCVPSKALIHAARIAATVRRGAEDGIVAGPPVVEFPKVMANIDRAIAGIAPNDSAERYRRMGVEVLQGRATIADPWTVEVTLADGGTQRLTTRGIVIATGAAPVMPPIPGLVESGAVTSDTLWDALRSRGQPKRLAVLGGGPVGVELAQAFAQLGSQVTLVEPGERVLAREEPEISALVAAGLARDGVRVATGTRATTAGRGPGGRWLHLTDGTRVEADEILVAAGRRPNTAGLGLERLGIHADGVIETDAWLQTVQPTIFAAGDVAGPWQFTHASGHQGWHAAVNALARPLWRVKLDGRAMPYGVFTDPEVGRLGLSEPEAQARAIPYEVTRIELSEVDRGMIDGAEGWLKVLTAPKRDRILGATVVGPRASELIAELALAMKHRLGLGAVLGTVHLYPSMSDANKVLAGRWRQRRLSPRLLDMAERIMDWRRG